MIALAQDIVATHGCWRREKSVFFREVTPERLYVMANLGFQLDHL